MLKWRQLISIYQTLIGTKSNKLVHCNGHILPNITNRNVPGLEIRTFSRKVETLKLFKYSSYFREMH